VSAPRPRARRRRELGFTLIEALISIVVMLIAMVGAGALQVAAAYSNRYSRELTQAAALATQMSELIQNWSFNDARLAPNSTVTGGTATWSAVSDATESMGRTMGYCLGSYSGCTSPDQRGTDASLPPASVDAFDRVYWNVVAEDQNNDAVPEAKLVHILVRWSIQGTWHNLNYVQARFNLDVLKPQ